MEDKVPGCTAPSGLRISSPLPAVCGLLSVVSCQLLAACGELEILTQQQIQTPQQ